MIMYSEVARHIPQSHQTRHLAASKDPPSNRTAEFLPFDQSTSLQNASFRQRLEIMGQNARPLQNTAQLPQQLASHASYTPSAEGSEHMLRRKTPNGTLAAGYDGSPVEWTKRPHAHKHYLTPVSNTTRQAAYPFRDYGQRHATQKFNISPQQQRVVQHQQNKLSRHGNYEPPENLDDSEHGAGWRHGGALPVGLDSVLNQSPLYNHHYNLASTHNVPTVLQPMWPPCLGPTSIHRPAPYGPYWPDGAFVPYRPAPVSDPKYHYQSSQQNSNLSLELRPAVNNYDKWLQAHSDSHMHPIMDTSGTSDSGFGLRRDGQRNRVSSVDVSIQNALVFHHDAGDVPRQHYEIPLAYRSKPPAKTEIAAHSANKTHHPHDFVAPVHDSESSTNNPHFKERVLSWAHRIYNNLLSSIEQARRHSQHDHHTQNSQIHTLHAPRRPYPSWSNNQQSGHKSHTTPKALSNPLSTPAQDNEHKSPRILEHDLRKSHSIHARTSSLPPNFPLDQSRQRWQPADGMIRTQVAASVPSYIPPHLASDSHTTSPSAAAAYAMEMLGRLCEESQWEWIDGMLLAGCLAYGLGDYNRATKWYWKVLHHDDNNVEAMSNLAATLLALNRREDAEQFWLRAVKLRPSYFEAIEHLIGLLHEGHRGKEAVKVIEFVEQALRVEIRVLTQEQAAERVRGRLGSYPAKQTSSRDKASISAFGSSGYAIPPADNGRMLALIHGKGNMLYQLGDNAGAAQAFEDAILVGAGKREAGIRGLIRRILNVFSDQANIALVSPHGLYGADEPILLPPDMALETSRIVFPPQGLLPGLAGVPDGFAQKAAVSIVSNSLLSLAKIYQDGMSSSGAAATAPRATSGVQEILALYYLSLSLQPSPSTANNVGILLASVQQSGRPNSSARIQCSVASTIPGVAPGSGIALALAYYDYGLKLDTRHAHLYTNLGSLFKDIGQLNAAIKMYEKAVDCDGNFDIALANLANAVKDQGKVSDAINYYERAVRSNPDFAEAVCGLANALNSVCSWSGRGGISHPRSNYDRWHVDEKGDLYDSRKTSGFPSGWIERVVAIVDKQLRDGESWGRGVLRSIGIQQTLQRLNLAYFSQDDSGTKEAILRNTLEGWADSQWEGAKVVRLIERATKNISQKLYRYQYIEKRAVSSNFRSRPQLPSALAVPSAPTVLPFHTFTCPLTAKQIRKISQRNGLRVSCSTLRAPWLPAQIYDPPPPPKPHLNVGYISSDFNNHPLAHLMQSVFGFHDGNRVKAFCYATTASDSSVHRQQIEREAPVFYDASSWPLDRLVDRVVADNIHILINLNGYTRGARNEVFAARPAPIQMSFMGFAGSLGAEWCDYLLADNIAIPPHTLRPWRGNVDLLDQAKDGNNDDEQDEWVYGENIIFTRDTFFCCDHRQSAPDSREPLVNWSEEQRRRWQMRKELFPSLPDDSVIFGNFNQLYKVCRAGTRSAHQY